MVAAQRRTQRGAAPRPLELWPELVGGAGVPAAATRGLAPALTEASPQTGALAPALAPAAPLLARFARPLPHPPRILIGLPYSNEGALSREAQALTAPVLISAGSLWRKGDEPGQPKTCGHRKGFATGRAPWTSWGAALDSAGFTAMMLGGYRWTVAQYVEAVVTNCGHGALPFPWRWWSAMDFCCENQIAPNREEVRRRMALTVATYAEILQELGAWRREGVTDVPDPLPVLQGRTADDYLWSAAALGEAIDREHPCICPLGRADDCAAEWHRAHAGLPALVGLGSVCRRDLRGPEGLLALLPALDAGLPSHVRLHLFGVKSGALLALRPWWHRIESVDSMAWDSAAREDARAVYRRTGENPSNNGERRARFMRSWYEAQLTGLRGLSVERAATAGACLAQRGGGVGELGVGGGAAAPGRASTQLGLFR